MRRLIPILVLLVACGASRAVAATAEETRMWRVANAAFKDGLYDLAERQAAELLAKFPDSERAGDTQLLLAQAQLSQGKSQASIDTLETGLRLPASERRRDSFQFWLAEARMRGEDFSGAEKAYGKLIEEFPRSVHRAQAYYGLAFVQFKSGRFDAAAETLERLRKLDLRGDSAQQAELLRGQIRLAQGHFDEADGIFDAAITNAPGTSLFFRAHVWRGESLARRGRYDEALTHYAVVLDAFKQASAPPEPKTPRPPVDGALAAEAWYGRGWTLWQQEQFADAAEAFAATLDNARSPQLKRDALLKLGESFVRAGKLEDGIARLKAFLKAAPNDPQADEVQMAVADLLFAHDSFKEALAEYAALMAGYPRSPLVARANFNAGWSAWRLADTEAALTYFKQAAALAKDAGTISEALFKVADAQFLLAQYSDAIATYQRLIGEYPDTKLIDRALFQLGQCYQRTRNAEAAAATFESLVERFPASDYAGEAQFQIGLINVGLGKEEAARAAFGEVVTKFAGTEWASKAALAVGESFYREAKYTEAITEFDKLVAAAPDSELGQRAFYNRGWCYFASGQADKTLAEFTEFLKKFAASSLAPDVQFWIADYHNKQKDYVKAQEQFQLLAKNYPASSLADTALFMAARAAYSRQDYKAAIELFESLLKTFPQSSFRCDARFSQGDALTELGQFDDALLVFDSVIKQFPNCYLACDAHGRRGDCLYTLERYDDAIASYRAALECGAEADPAFRNQIRYKLGQSYEKHGKLPDAFEQYSKVVYESAVAPEPTAPPERFWLCKAGLAAAGIKEQQQQWKDAITLYQKLLDLCPDMKPLLEDRIRKLRVEHLILF
jgi:TolA-binding protein